MLHCWECVMTYNEISFEVVTCNPSLSTSTVKVYIVSHCHSFQNDLHFMLLSNISMYWTHWNSDTSLIMDTRPIYQCNVITTSLTSSFRNLDASSTSFLNTCAEISLAANCLPMAGHLSFTLPFSSRTTL